MSPLPRATAPDPVSAEIPMELRTTPGVYRSLMFKITPHRQARGGWLVKAPVGLVMMTISATTS
jgi:hypothetical protein